MDAQSQFLPDSPASIPARITDYPRPPKSFGKIFDELGQAHVQQSVHNLKEQLDNLMLFATLFSAINSAFLIFSLPTLASPQLQTNILLVLMIQTMGGESAGALAREIVATPVNSSQLNIAVNVLFSTSLICSLITAFFAAVGKQWVTHYAKEPIASDSQKRTNMERKIIDARHYSLHTILDAALMTVIEFALFLFGLGFTLFLMTINSTVTWFVVPVAAIGLLLYLISAGLAVWDLHCPYQTPMTTTIIPAFFRSLYWTIHAAAMLINMTRLAVASAIDKLIAVYRGREPTDEARLRREALYDAVDSFRAQMTSPQLTSPIGRYECDPTWDSYYQRRGKIGTFFRRSGATDSQYTAEAASWVIEISSNADHILAVAFTFLDLRNREALSFVARPSEGIHRLRKKVRVPMPSDGEGLQSGDVKLSDEQWKLACFYVHVLSHIFAGMKTLDPQWYDDMNSIYYYQTQQARGGSREHAHTVVPARMVGVIKVLLARRAGLRLDGKVWNKERERILRSRLYNVVSEQDCTPRALSLTAFAIHVLGSGAPQDVKNTREPPNCSLCIGIRGSKGPDDSKPSIEEVHNELWTAYISEAPEEVYGNVANAFGTYAKYHALPSAPLPEIAQFSKFCDEALSYIKSHPILSTSATNDTLVSACIQLARASKISELDSKTDGQAMHNTVIETLCTSLDLLVAGYAQDKQLAPKAGRWCQDLVELHSIRDSDINGKLLKRVTSIIQHCDEALPSIQNIKAEGWTLVELIEAVGRVLKDPHNTELRVEHDLKGLLDVSVDCLGHIFNLFSPSDLVPTDEPPTSSNRPNLLESEDHLLRNALTSHDSLRAVVYVGRVLRAKSLSSEQKSFLKIYQSLQPVRSPLVGAHYVKERENLLSALGLLCEDVENTEAVVVKASGAQTGTRGDVTTTATRRSSTGFTDT